MSRSVGAERHGPAWRRTTRAGRHAVTWWWLAAALLPAPAAAQDTDARGREAGRPGAPGGSMREWRAAAQNGDKDASFALGLAYDLGQGARHDARLACRYYTEAGNRGHVSGAFNAAVLYDSGQCGDTRRTDLAAVWYGRAAAAGAGRAQFNLALLYASGEGVPRNPAVAASWFRAAAANGVAAATGRASDTSRANGGQGPLLPVIPAFPAAAQVLPPGDAATLVWTAPNQPDPVRFFVEVFELKPSGPVEIAGRYVDVTSLRVSLPADATQLTWRVLTVGTDPPRYVVGPWRDFTAAPAAAKPN